MPAAGFEPLDSPSAPLGRRYRCLAFRVDGLRVYVYPDREAMGHAAAWALGEWARRIAEERGAWSCVFAAAPSQNDVLGRLIEDADLPWDRLCFGGMMDEYLRLTASHPRSFRHYHNTRLWGPLLLRGRALDPQVIHQLRGEAPDPVAEAARYAELVRAFPPDLVQGGIGEENAHLAFNDPPEARFDDPELVKVIEVAPAAKLQQVHEGHFRDPAEVPDALTLSLPALTRFPLPSGAAHTVRYWSCVAPTRAKATAVEKLLLGEITEAVPATVLRTLPEAALFLDPDAASRLHQRGLLDLAELG